AKPLRDYAPVLMAIKDAGDTAAQTMQQGKEYIDSGLSHLYAGIDQLYEKLGMELTLEPARMVFTSDQLDPDNPIVVDLGSTPRDLARGILSWVNQLDGDPQASLEAMLAPQ